MPRPKQHTSDTYTQPPSSPMSEQPDYAGGTSTKNSSRTKHRSHRSGRRPHSSNNLSLYVLVHAPHVRTCPATTRKGIYAQTQCVPSFKRKESPTLCGGITPVRRLLHPCLQQHISH